MTDSDPYRLLYGVLLLAMIIPAYLVRRRSVRQDIKYALAWGMILLVLAAGWSLFR